MTPEGKVKKDIKAGLNIAQEQKHLRYFMPEHMGMGESGVSDFIGVIVGEGFAIEAKRAETTGDKVEYATPWQFRFLKEWREAGGLAGVARSWEDANRIISADFKNQGPIDPLQPDRTE